MAANYGKHRRWNQQPLLNIRHTLIYYFGRVYRRNKMKWSMQDVHQLTELCWLIQDMINITVHTQVNKLRRELGLTLYPDPEEADNIPECLKDAPQ